MRYSALLLLLPAMIMALDANNTAANVANVAANVMADVYVGGWDELLNNTISPTPQPATITEPTTVTEPTATEPTATAARKRRTFNAQNMLCSIDDDIFTTLICYDVDMAAIDFDADAECDTMSSPIKCYRPLA